jgi:predicted neutral ceramidase superfamily lipid hydrolase
MNKMAIERVTQRVRETVKEAIGEVARVEVQYRTDMEGETIWIESVKGEIIEKV